jgi:hypothetical protein
MFVAVQHHPERAALLEPLVPRLGPGPVVVTDPDPDGGIRSPWRTYRACLEVAAVSGDSHALVVQDDAVPCPLSFWEAVCGAATHRPDRVLVLFVPGALRAGAARVRAYANRGDVWAPLDGHSWLPVVANVYPTSLIVPLLEWVDRQRWPPKFRADDEIIGRAVNGIRARALACSPSLVEHPDVTPSLVGDRHRAGRDTGRVAACYIDDCDPLSMDWGSGAR